MRYVIDLDKIQFGDIILIRTNDRTCAKIREFSKSNFSHGLICKGNVSCLESNAFGVQSVNPQRLVFENHNDAIALRLKNESKIEKLKEGLTNASMKIGMAYASRHELMKSYVKTLESAEEGRRQFCTRFVAQVYEESGIKIVENPDYCSPKDIEESASLCRIEDILKEGSKQEIELALDEKNVVSRQTESTFNFLEGVRNLTSEDIQTFDDVDDFLLNNPQFNDQIDAQLKGTDYLKLGDLEKESNPEFYDLDLFLEKFGETQAYLISFQELPNELTRKFNFEQAIEKYKSLFEQYNLTYFKSHLDCYKRQLELSLERLNIFEEIIK